MAAITNYHKVHGLEQPNVLSHTFCSSEVQNGSHSKLKSRYLQGGPPRWRPVAESVFLPFPAFRDQIHSLVEGLLPSSSKPATVDQVLNL